MLASGFRPVGRDFPGVPASGHARGVRARAHRAQARPRLSRLRVLRVAGRDARGGPRAPRPHDQRDGAGDDGTLVDPYGGAADLAAGVLRHVSPAFAEDPLRVLRVARFAARFGFAVAPETEALMRDDRGVRRARDARAGARVAGTRARPHGSAPVAHARGAARLRRARRAAAGSRRALRRAAAAGASSGDRHRRARRAGARLGGGARTRRCRRATRCSRTISARRNRRPTALPRHIAHEQRSVRLARAAVGAPAACRSIAAMPRALAAR